MYNASVYTFRSPVCRMLRLLASCLSTGMVTDAAVEQLCAGAQGEVLEGI